MMSTFLVEAEGFPPPPPNLYQYIQVFQQATEEKFEMRAELLLAQNAREVPFPAIWEV